MLQMVQSPIAILPTTPPVLPWNTDLVHPLQQDLQLISLKLSGNPCEIETFRKSLRSSSWPGINQPTIRHFSMETNRWYTYCQQREIHTTLPTLEELVEYFTYLTNQLSLSLGMICNARRCLKCILDPVSCQLFADPMFVDLFSGIKNVNPKLPKLRQPIWNMEQKF